MPSSIESLSQYLTFHSTRNITFSAFEEEDTAGFTVVCQVTQPNGLTYRYDSRFFNYSTPINSFDDWVYKTRLDIETTSFVSKKQPNQWKNYGSQKS